VRLSRLKLYYDGKSSHLAPKIEIADLDAIFVAIRNGFTATRTNVESHIKERVKAATEALEAQFEARVAAAVEAELEFLTSPEQAA
jgi:aminoglycoside/choline kinase family phosphotransferase